MNKKIKIIFIIFSFFFFVALQAGHFPKEVIMIGDSLSDSGNSGPGHPLATNPFVVGFPALFVPKTNGTTWIVHLSRMLRTEELKPRVQGGTNFAYSAATTVLDIVTISLANQVELIPSNISKKDPVFIWGGANNIFFSSSDQVLSARLAAQDIANIVDSLHEKKFKTLIVCNLMDIGTFPFSTAIGMSSLYHESSLAFNQTWLKELQKRKYHILAIDTAALFDDIGNNLLKYGFFFPVSSAPSSAAVLPLNLGATPAGYMYWYDGTHPTEALHLLIADYAFSIITSPYCYSKLSDETFGVIREQKTNIQQQLYPKGPKLELKKFYAFVDGTYSPLLSLPSQDFGCNGDVMGGNVCLGVMNHVSELWTLGIAGEYSNNFLESDHCHSACDFDLQTATLSLFSGVGGSIVYLNSIVDMHWLFFDDIHRNFFVGPVNYKTDGKTSGMGYDAEIYGTYFFVVGDHYKMGPIFDLNYQKVFIDGYKESGADIGNIIYKDQTNSVFVSGLGWEVTLNKCMKWLNLSTEINLLFNRQWLGNTRHIHFREVSLPGVWGEWPIEKHQMNFLSGGINFNALFSNGIVGSFGFSFNVGTFNTEEYFLTTGLTIPLGKYQKNPLCNL